MFQSYTNKALFRSSPVVATLFLHELLFKSFAESSLQEHRKDWITVYVEKLYIHIIQLCILFASFQTSVPCANSPWGGGGYSLIWVIRVRAAGQGMVFWPRCPKQGIQFDLPLS